MTMQILTLQIVEINECQLLSDDVGITSTFFDALDAAGKVMVKYKYATHAIYIIILNA